MISLGNGDSGALFRDIQRFRAVVGHRAGDFAAHRIGRLPLQNFRRACGSLAGIRVERTGAGNGSTILAVGLVAFEQLVRYDGIAREVHQDFARLQHHLAVILISHS